MRPAVALGLLAAAGLQVAALVVLDRPAPPRHPELAARWAELLDGDGDGVVSAAEARARSLPGAPEWDLNDDGVLSPGELEAMLWALPPGALYETATGR